MWSNKLKLSLLGLAILSSACAHEVPDTEVCVELSMDRAFCRKTISDVRMIVDEAHPMTLPDGTKKTWFELRHTTVKVPAHSWAKIKKFIVLICKDSELCQQNVSSWDRATADVDLWLKEQYR